MNGHRYSAVTRSGWHTPEVAPASTAMLQSVMREAMFMASTTGPVNSITMSVPPPMVSCLMMVRITSLANTPRGRVPVTSILIDLGVRKAQTPL